ncbi:MAG: hypothetical protein A2Y14_05410 [Verrucomicrobia bacterium GWF2_51_19]|nr:MAG: hypothetical protein A2Y14_05410 [Verrucomicrobia bacterium GWF2_51_19]HCJ12447.1 hypothetical protein [Opitutae bacterium]
MKWKTTILLILANVLVFVWIYKRGHYTHGVKSDEFVFAHKLESVDWFEISGKALPQKRILKRDRDAWLLVEPVQWAANNFAVLQILSQLRYLEKEVSFSLEDIKASGQTLEDYGLAEPSLIIRFGDRDHTYELRVGQPAKIGQRIYIFDPETENVLVVSEALRDSLLVELAALRDYHVIALKAFDIHAVKVKKDNLAVFLEKSKELWGFIAPIHTKADTKALDGVLSDIAESKAEAFIDDYKDLAEFGLDTPEVKITLQGPHSKETLCLGKQVPEKNLFYVKREDAHSVFTLPIRLFARLLSAQEALRDSRIWTFSPERLTRIEIAGKDRSVSLQKLENGPWQVLAENKAHIADEEGMRNLILSLQGLEAIRFVNDAPSAVDLTKLGFDEPRREVRLSFVEEQKWLTLTGTDENNALYAKTKDLPFIYEVRRWILDDLSLNSLHYRNKVLEKLPEAAKVEKVELLDREKPILSVELKDETAFEAPAGFSDKEKEALFTIVGNLHEVECKELLMDSFKPQFELDASTPVEWRYKLIATIFLPGKEEREQKVYFLSERLGGTFQIGGSIEKQLTFSLKQEWIDALAVLIKKSL